MHCILRYATECLPTQLTVNVQVRESKFDWRALSYRRLINRAETGAENLPDLGRKSQMGADSGDMLTSNKPAGPNTLFSIQQIIQCSKSGISTVVCLNSVSMRVRVN